MEQIQDRGIVIRAAIHGNSSQIVTIFSKHYGVINGYIKGGFKKNALIVGNIVDFLWQARVVSHLGNLEIVILENFSTVFATNILKMTTIQTICEVIYRTINERDQHTDLFESILPILQKLKDTDNNNIIANLYIQFEILLFNHLGFGFNFKECNISGSEKPEFISPKTGNAVSKKIATGYENQLFKIPTFILQNLMPSGDEVQNMLVINLHFLHLHFGGKEYHTRKFLQTLLHKLCV